MFRCLFAITSQNRHISLLVSCHVKKNPWNWLLVCEAFQELLSLDSCPNLWRSDQGYACGCAAWPSRGYKWSVCGLWSIVYGWMNHWLWQGVSSMVEEWFESLTWLKCEIILVGPNIILVSAMLDWTDGLMRLTEQHVQVKSVVPEFWERHWMDTH
jgi:hypothetical protein